MKCTFNDNEVLWQVGETTTKISLCDIDQAMYSAEKNVVIVIAGADQASKKLSVYELSGKLRCIIEQPKETYFNGLGPNRGQDVTVFATVYQLGWCDWWLSINIETATVERLGEGR
jgi:hypothetical protein